MVLYMIHIMRTKEKKYKRKTIGDPWSLARLLHIELDHKGLVSDVQLHSDYCSVEFEIGNTTMYRIIISKTHYLVSIGNYFSAVTQKQFSLIRKLVRSLD